MILILHRRSAFAPIPAGLILPYYTSDPVPGGWAEWTDADDHFIIGAGGAIAAGSVNAGSALSISLASGGSHYGSTYSRADLGFGGANSYGPCPDGAHSHAAISAYWNPAAVKVRLIRARTHMAQLPPHCVLLSYQPLSGGDKSRILDADDRYFLAAAAIGSVAASIDTSGFFTGGSSVTSPSATFSHNHQSPSYTKGSTVSGAGYDHVSAGPSHSHTIGVANISDDLHRAYLYAWTNASAKYNLEQYGIGMWEYPTPPSGWKICNGDAGTPDLRDYFLCTGPTCGAKSGSNALSGTGSTSSGGTHGHDSSYSGAAYSSWPHPTGEAHTHTPVLSGSRANMPYYGLYFVIKS